MIIEKIELEDYMKKINVISLFIGILFLQCCHIRVIHVSPNGKRHEKFTREYLSIANNCTISISRYSEFDIECTLIAINDSFKFIVKHWKYYKLNQLDTFLFANYNINKNQLEEELNLTFKNLEIWESDSANNNNSIKWNKNYLPHKDGNNYYTIRYNNQTIWIDSANISKTKSLKSIYNFIKGY